MATYKTETLQKHLRKIALQMMCVYESRLQVARCELKVKEIKSLEQSIDETSLLLNRINCAHCVDSIRTILIQNFASVLTFVEIYAHVAAELSTEQAVRKSALKIVEFLK